MTGKLLYIVGKQIAFEGTKSVAFGAGITVLVTAVTGGTAAVKGLSLAKLLK